MAAIVSGIGHFFQAILEVIQGMFSTIFSIFSGVIDLGVQTVEGIVSLFGGVVGFILGNIVTIAVVAGLFYGYQVYQKRQGKTVGIKRA